MIKRTKLERASNFIANLIAIIMLFILALIGTTAIGLALMLAFYYHIILGVILSIPLVPCLIGIWMMVIEECFSTFDI